MKKSLIQVIRSHPHMYSAVCRARVSYSRYFKAISGRSQLRREQSLFAMNEVESAHCDELRLQGFTVLEGFFDTKLTDQILERVDILFKNLHLDFQDAYSVRIGSRISLEGLSYDELKASEKMICVKDPLLSLPESVTIALNESILKIVTNFLGYIVPWYKAMIIRDFPFERPRESSNFHRDNDETDSVQAFVYLVDIDDTRGPLVYVPGSHRYDVKSCRPRHSLDLGIDSNDGRISDSEIEKYYPKDSWKTLRVKRGSLAIIHGNGLHKGPCWAKYGDPNNQSRTAIRLDFHGPKNEMNIVENWKGNKIGSEAYHRLSRLQRLFTNDAAVVY